MSKILFLCGGVVAWLSVGASGEAMVNASERVRFAKLYQDPSSSQITFAWFFHALGGPMALAGDSAFVFLTSDAGYQGFNFNSAPFPCTEDNALNRKLWCGSDA